MDEPFAAIDPVVRERLRGRAVAVAAAAAKTIVLVTHDINETIRLGDKIAIFGKAACWRSLIPRPYSGPPGSEFVRRFIGRAQSETAGHDSGRPAAASRCPLLDEALTPIASAHPPLASPLRLVLDRQRPAALVRSATRSHPLPVERPLASSHSLRLPTARCSTWRPACWCMWMAKDNTEGRCPTPCCSKGARRRGGGETS